MSAVQVGINGFGRIGRNYLRASLTNKDVDIVAVNDLSNAHTLAHLLKYDSNYGRINAEVSSKDDKLIVNGKEIQVLAKRDPKELPWKDLGVEVVVESTGLFKTRDKASLHLEAGAKKVIISAPSSDPDATFVMGVNEKTYDPSKHHIISNASCTTNCLAPVAKVLLENFGIVSGLMTTIHSYTNGQKILDMQDKDLRRARAAALSIIPTSTGAAKAVGLVLPEVKGKLTGFAFRVPTPTVSVVDLTVITEKACSSESINAAMKAAAAGPLKGILKYEEEPLVSMDFKGNMHSSIFDPEYTLVLGEKHAKVISWYDNEMGYSCRLVELSALVCRSM